MTLINKIDALTHPYQATQVLIKHIEGNQFTGHHSSHVSQVLRAGAPAVFDVRRGVIIGVWKYKIFKKHTEV